MEDFFQRVFTTPHFSNYEGYQQNDGTSIIQCIRDTSTRSDDKTIWISKPKEYERETPYLAYGNEAHMEWLYSWVALLVFPKGTLTKGGEKVDVPMEMGQ